MKELEEFVYEKYLKPNIIIKDGKETIDEKYLDEIPDLVPQERKFIDYIVSQRKIVVNPRMIEESDRSKLVRDSEYGRIKSNGLSEYDEPKYAVLQYDNGSLIYEDYKKLDDFVEKTLIPENVVMKIRKNDNSGRDFFPSIQYNSIIKYKLNEREIEHVLNYLAENDIRVGGIDQGLDGEFENYDYFRTYKSVVLPKPLEKDELIEKFILLRATNDHVIREQLILTNMRLVTYNAWKYALMYNFPKEDAEQYGYEGLINAVDKFDPTLGYAFSTYATASIKNTITSAIHDEYDTPSRNWLGEYKIAKSVVEKRYQTTVKESPFLIEEIADLMAKIHNYSDKKKAVLINRIKIIEKESLDELVDNGYDVISKDNIDNPINSAENEELKQMLKNVTSTLTEREERVIRLRFGLDDGKTKTLEEVGNLLHLTRVRVRQIEAKALRRLRHPSRARKINSLLDEDGYYAGGENYTSIMHDVVEKNNDVRKK